VELYNNLKELLKLLTDNCPKYIDGVFAGHTDYNDYDLKKHKTLSIYNAKKIYYENLMRMYSSSCSNPYSIKSIYSIYFNYYFKGPNKKNEDKKRKNILLRTQLLEITSMKPYIYSIIEETPIPETYLQSSLSGGKTNNQQHRPTKLLFGKVRCIYKKSGDKKEYVKHKGLLITIKQYRDIRTRATKNRGK